MPTRIDLLVGNFQESAKAAERLVEEERCNVLSASRVQGNSLSSHRFARRLPVRFRAARVRRYLARLQ
jgi:hypothetical protein